MVNDPTVADRGPDDANVQEPALAVTRAYRVSPYQVPYSSTVFLPVRAARGNNQSANWTASDVGSFVGGDCSVAVADATVGAVKFVIFAMWNNVPNGTIRYALYQPDAEVPFTPWTTAFLATGTGVAADKPWVIRRSSQDFFLFWFNGLSLGYSYLRTNDGSNWGNPDSPLLRYAVGPTPSDPYPGEFCCQPSVGADGDIYLAHALDPTVTGGTIRVLRGWDPEGDNSGPLHFEYLSNSSGVLDIPLRTAANLPLPVPANYNVESKRVPYLVCDPTSADRAYIFYHDVDVDSPIDDTDVNVYCARLTRIEGNWSASVGIVGENAQKPGTSDLPDQFVPTAAVDSKGWIHVIYYDNRPAPGLAGWEKQYDVRYALSTDQGLTWTVRNLRSDPDALPILDLGLQGFGTGIPPNWGPREYNGMAIYESAGVSHVWVTYMGANSDTSPEENPQHLSRIFASHIAVGP